MCGSGGGVAGRKEAGTGQPIEAAGELPALDSKTEHRTVQCCTQCTAFSAVHHTVRYRQQRNTVYSAIHCTTKCSAVYSAVQPIVKCTAR